MIHNIIDRFYVVTGKGQVSIVGIRATELDRQLGRSFMYKIKSKGPRIVPCGIPQVRI